MLELRCGILQMLFPSAPGYCFILNISGKRIWTWSADTFLINMTVFETGLKIWALHARFTEFSWADEALEASSPGTPEGRTIMESKFERIIVTADVWRKRNITASKHKHVGQEMYNEFFYDVGWHGTDISARCLQVVFTANVNSDWTKDRLFQP